MKADFINIKVIDHIYNNSVNLAIDIFGNLQEQIFKLMKVEPNSDLFILFGIWSNHFKYFLYKYCNEGKNIVFDLFRELNC